MLNSAELLAENYQLKQRIAELEYNQDLLRFDTFQKTLEVFLKQHTLYDILDGILEQATKVIRANSAFIYLQGTEPATLELRASYGLENRYIHSHIRIHNNIVGKVWQSQKPMLNIQADTDDSALLFTQPQQYIALFPMKNNRTIFGVMGFTYSCQETTLINDFIHMLESFVNLATIAAENAQVHDALNNSRTVVNQITETIPDIVFIHDIRRKEIVYLNSAFSRILGYPINEFIAHPTENILTIIHPDDHALIGEEYVNLVRGVRDYHEFVYRMKTHDGEWRWFNARYQVFVYDNHRPHQILGILQDITEHRQAEHQRLALRMERDRVELLRDFVRDASHSFRTPLATINTSVYLIRKIDTPDNRDKHLDLIKRQVHVLDQLVDALLMMSRLDSGVSMTLNMLDVTALLHEIYHDMLMYDNQFDIVLSITGELSWLACDRYWMYKALSEIIQNSLQHARERIIIHAQQQSSTIYIEIKDDGDGIHPQEVEHVFDRFYRGEKSRIRGGLGLGLSIARKVIAEHGGEISIRSELEKGTVCRITLPLFDSY